MQNFLIIPGEWNRYKQLPGQPCLMRVAAEEKKKKEERKVNV